MKAAEYFNQKCCNEEIKSSISVGFEAHLLLNITILIEDTIAGLAKHTKTL